MRFHGLMAPDAASPSHERELVRFEGIGVVRDGNILLLEATGAVQPARSWH